MTPDAAAEFFAASLAAGIAIGLFFVVVTLAYRLAR